MSAMAKGQLRGGFVRAWRCLALALACLFLLPAPAAAADADHTITVSVSFVGPNKDEWDRVEDLTIPDDATAWSATTEALAKSHLFYTTGLPSSRNVLASLTPDLDEVPYAFDPATGSGWRLYVNDKRYRGPASALALADGDSVSWRYEVGKIVVRVSVVGPGGTGQSFWIHPTNVRITYAQNAWDATRKVLQKKGYTEGRLLSYDVDEDGSVALRSLAALGENGITGESWHAYLNGVWEEDIAHAELRAGDSICWYYAGNGERTLPPFAIKSGAASQNPATLVRVEGTVAQQLSQPVLGGDGALASLGNESGLRLCGDGLLVGIASSDVVLPGNLAEIASARAWEQSLARLLDEANRYGEGGLASQGRDGSVWYLDGHGDVVKLGLETD